MTNKAKKVVFKTPAGIAQYPWLNQPDTQFDAAGQYKVNLRLSKDEAKSLIETVKKAANDAFGDKAKSANLPIVNDEETGDVIIKTKSKYQPSICDSTGRTLAGNAIPKIFGGSEMIVAGTLFPYTAGGRHGISLQLGGVQLIRLAENSNAAGINFGAVEGGFVAANDNPEDEGEDSYNF